MNGHTATPEHLAPLEAAARIFCAKIGANPDEQVQVPHPFIQGAAISAPLWYGPAEELLHLATMIASLKEANSAPKVIVQ